MKNLKYITVCLLLFVGVSSMSAQKGIQLQNKQVQTKRTANLEQEKHQKMMQEELSLTDDQMKKIEMIQSKRADEIQKLREQIWSLKEEEHKEIQEILTPEQREISEKLRENRGMGNHKMKQQQQQQQQKRNMKMKGIKR